MPHLRDARGKILLSWEGSDLPIGRNPGSDGLTLHDPYCAPLHATIHTDPNGWWIEATGGVIRLNGSDIDRAWLAEGDTLQVGRNLLTFSLQSSLPPEPPVPTATFYLHRTDTGERWPLDGPHMVIGSNPASGNLPAFGGLRSSHAEIGMTPEGLWFRDSAGMGDVIHNGRAVREGWLEAGDTLAVGPYTFTIEGPARKRTRRPIRKKVFIGAGILLFLLLVVLPLILVAPSGEWSLLPSMVRSLISHGPSGRLNPSPPPDSGSKALDISPSKGIRIRAPKNALDKPRDFTARSLTRETADQTFRTAGLSGGLSLAGVSLDSGMEEWDRYPGEVILDFDLKDLDIPRSLWDTTRLIQIEDDGSVSLLQSEQKGSTVTAKIERNSVIILVGAIVIPAGLAYFGYKDLSNVPGGPFISFLLPDASQFLIHLGTKTFPVRKPGVVKDTIDQMNAKRRALGLTQVKFNPAEYPYISISDPANTTVNINAEAELRQDPEYISLEKRWRDHAWVRENVIPLKVHLTGLALKHAREYLKGRNFRWPTYTIEIFIPDKTMSGFGYTEDLWLKRPYILLNQKKIPSDEPGTAAWTSEVQGCWDNMNMTVVHELFHIIQTRYFWIPEIMGYDTWFFEATAVVLEAEAGKAYLAKPEYAVKSYHGTVRDYGPFRRELDFTSGSLNERQNHGYCASYFLEYLRNVYYPSNPDDFLQKLMEDYSAFRGGRLASLYRVTSSRADRFGVDYASFIGKHQDDLFLDTAYYDSVMITDKDPYTLWAHKELKELRAPVLEVNLKAPKSSTKDLEDVVFVAKDEAGSTMEFASGYKLRMWDAFGGTWGELKSPTAVTIPKNWESKLKGTVASRSTSFSGCQEIMKDETIAGADFASRCRTGGIPFRLIRLEPYLFSVFSSWNRSSGKGVHCFALFKPKAAPRFTPDWKENKLDVRIPPSVIAEKKLLEGYILTLERWESIQKIKEGKLVNELTAVAPKIQVFMKMDEHDVDLTPVLEPEKQAIPMIPAEILGPISPDELIDMIEISRTYFKPAGELRITYREVVSKDDKIFGPESEPFKLPVEIPEPEVDLVGHWKGKVWIARIDIDLTITGTKGKDIEGTWDFQGTKGPFLGTWKAKERGWEMLLMVEDEKEGKMPVLMSPYLRPLPGNKLWLAAPPAVFRQPGASANKAAEEKKKGWVEEWFPWFGGKKKEGKS
ncbi:MAG TPA: FHA domain-containing protein [Thermoanaerobaculia bacterium]|nr:FHA domain-containing protein [Thermoanaerobaculia bacterium]HUM30597.1 FHA domain-containing protein [Thermoanaerobaculia bacterium]HXK68875.1 FHA domain-containing protein [Thermoanaerobaculia bacterium]